MQGSELEIRKPQNKKNKKKNTFIWKRHL